MNTLNKRLKNFFDQLKLSNLTSIDVKKIKSAYNFALKKHENQLRKSGEAYIIHPLETAISLLEWKMDCDTIITGLLHDILEDTDCTEKQMEKKFGPDITKMVKIVSKVSKISDKNRSEPKIKYDNNEYLIKVLMSISSDIRPMMVKIADRLHNMRTISHLKKEKQEKIANETFNIYANIAGRLGMYHQKTMLLDLSFSVLEPDRYEKMKKKLDDLVKNNKDKLNNLKTEILNILKLNQIECVIIERIKGVYSTFKKHERGINLNEIHDIFALRIIGEYNELKCYEILGIIHLNFTQLPKTFKDYISNPKLNMYQSIHTTITFKRILVEIQIRNNVMDNIANLGIASHWQYKEENKETKKFQESLIKDIIEKNDGESGQRLKYLSRTSIFDVLLMNNSKWYIMNENSTALDLAYKYNPNKVAFISKITKEGVPILLSHPLRKDDIISIDYSEKIQADNSWVEYTTIDDCKEIFEKMKVEDVDYEVLEDQFFTYLKKTLGPNIALAKDIKKRLQLLGIDTLKDFIKNFHNNSEIDNQIVSDLFNKNKIWKDSFRYLLNLRNKNTLDAFDIKNIKGLFFKKIHFTNCCTKLPGIEIVGNLIKNDLYIHKFNCKHINKTKKIVVLQWNDEKLEEFPNLFNFTFFITYNKKNMRTNKILHVITGKGFEIISIEAKIEPQSENVKVKFIILSQNYLLAKKLLDEIKNKFNLLQIDII
ncbi:MAG: RelA/SpoT family protein [Malacoplasma sp.]